MNLQLLKNLFTLILLTMSLPILAQSQDQNPYQTLLENNPSILELENIQDIQDDDSINDNLSSNNQVTVNSKGDVYTDLTNIQNQN